MQRVESVRHETDARLWIALSQGVERCESVRCICRFPLAGICQMIGIKDIHVKVEGGSSNTYAITKAFMTGLLNQETFQVREWTF